MPVLPKKIVANLLKNKQKKQKKKTTYKKGY